VRRKMVRTLELSVLGVLGYAVAIFLLLQYFGYGIFSFQGSLAFHPAILLTLGVALFVITGRYFTPEAHQELLKADKKAGELYGRVIFCGFLNSLTLSLILGLQKARKRVRRVEGFAFGSRDFILSRTSNIPSGPSLLATSLSTSNTHFLNPFLSLRDTSRSPGLQAGKKRAEPSGPPTILWRINASTNVPRMIRIIVPASLIILPEL